jgi:hypothetical protein
VITSAKAILAVVHKDDYYYPCSVEAEKLKLLGVFEHKTVKTGVDSGNSVVIHTGATKILEGIAKVEGTVVSPFTVEECQDIMDQTGLHVVVIDLKSFNSLGIDTTTVDISSLMTAKSVECFSILHYAQIKASVDVTSNDVTRIKFEASVSDSYNRMQDYVMENVRMFIGDDAWEYTSLIRSVVASILSSTVTIDLVYQLRGILPVFWDWKNTSHLGQAGGGQLHNHDNSVLLVADDGPSYNPKGYYTLDGVNPAILRESALTPIASSSKYGMVFMDMTWNDNAEDDYATVFRFRANEGEDYDGFYVQLKGTNEIRVRWFSTAGTANDKEHTLTIVGEDFTLRSERIILLDFSQENLYYVNKTMGIIQSEINDSGKTITFNNANTAGDSTDYINVSASYESGNQSMNLHKLGYAMW